MNFIYREYVEGYYEYGMPLDENIVKTINLYFSERYENFNPISLEDLEHFAKKDTSWDRYNEEIVFVWTDVNKTVRRTTEKLGAAVYEYLCDNCYEFNDDNGFEYCNTFDHEVFVE